MSKLLYEPCACLRRGVAFRPGSRGHLYVYVNDRLYFVRKCRHCRTKDEKLQLGGR